ncbi:expressed unknown protein [Seminavis robusta]|uniref:Uncharacterized protein n=1 Tax=Seminavis robusta TaxID=568900 RepID=A0A9N8HE69_9STRA|nr:expressed unknown protein [Seminavis robusta]|eukprot:Sro290_g109231.1  (126) ;mRNA; f:6431-6808
MMLSASSTTPCSFHERGTSLRLNMAPQLPSIHMHSWSPEGSSQQPPRSVEDMDAFFSSKVFLPDIPDVIEKDSTRPCTRRLLPRLTMMPMAMTTEKPTTMRRMMGASDCGSTSHHAQAKTSTPTS